MAKKKSLGHSPLGIMTEEKLNYDFIPNLNEKLVREVDHPDKINNLIYELEPESTNKIVVSYYLDESIIKKLKQFAKRSEQSYSAVAGNAFTFYLQEQGLY